MSLRARDGVSRAHRALTSDAALARSDSNATPPPRAATPIQLGGYGTIHPSPAQSSDTDTSRSSNETTPRTTATRIQRSWYGRIDWVLVGYSLMIAASTLYLVVAVAPYESVLYENGLDGYLSLVAAIFFLIESMFYHVSMWIYYQHTIQSGQAAPDLLRDFNLYGNIGFTIGSIGYLWSNVWYIEGRYESSQEAMALAMALVFVVDALFYLGAALSGEHARAPRLSDTGAEPRAISFQAETNWYLLASWGFLLGTGLDVLLASLPYCGLEPEALEKASSIVSLAEAITYMFDSILYFISGLQDARDSSSDADEPMLSNDHSPEDGIREDSEI